MKEKERIPKLILVPESIECRSWTLADKENTEECYTCKSRLFYVRKHTGVVDEGQMHIQVLTYKDKDESFLALRTVGLAMFCAECGAFHDDYYKYFFPEDKVICTWDDDELNLADKEELDLAIDLFNKTGKIELPFQSTEISYLKKKIEEHFSKKKEDTSKKEQINATYGLG